MIIRLNVFIFCFLFSFSVKAVVIGSNTLTSRQALAIFPAGDVDNEMRGFAAFENGFTLNGGGNCIFNSLYPVSGNMTLNGGTLSLSKDMICEKDAVWVTGGTLLGNGRAVTFMVPGTVTLPQSLTTVASSGYLTEINIGAGGNSMSWSYNNNRIAVAQSGFVNVYTYNGSSISSAGSVAADGAVNAVSWHPTDLYLAAGQVRSSSSSKRNVQVWLYNTTTNSFTLKSSIKPNTDCNAVAWHPSGNFLAAGCKSGTNELVIYRFSSETLSQLTVVNFANSRDIQQNSLSWQGAGNYLAVGTANSAVDNELLIYSFNGSTLKLHASSNINETVSALSYSPTGSYLAVGLSSGSERIRIYSHNTSAGTLTEQTSARVGESLSILALQWSPNGNYLAVGRAAGIGTELRVYRFDSSKNTLTLVTEFDVINDVIGLSWSRDGSYIATGDSKNYLNVYGFTPDVTGDLVCNNTKFVFNQDVLLQNNITFQGNCAIDAQGHSISFSPGSSMIVASGANLYLQNIILQNLAGTNLRGLDSTSRIFFDEAVVVMSGNYTFAQGYFDVLKKLYITGPYEFSYQTDQASTIASGATLYLDTGVIFRCDPSGGSNTFLQCTDSTSGISLKSATLSVSSRGLQITKGTIMVDGKSYLESEGTTSAQGFILGDGLTVANNVILRILPAANLIVKSGFLVNKNV